MTKTVHGHELMNLMMEMGKPLSLDTLEKLSAERFGDGVTFHTCSTENMSVTELVEFLQERGKIVETADGLILSGATCGHQH